MSTEPDAKRDLESQIKKIMTVFYPALICPSEMWWQVLEALGPPDRINEKLESLSAELAASLREQYHVMPPLCYYDYLQGGDRSDARSFLCSEMIEWCEKASGESAS